MRSMYCLFLKTAECPAYTYTLHLDYSHLSAAMSYEHGWPVPLCNPVCSSLEYITIYPKIELLDCTIVLRLF